VNVYKESLRCTYERNQSYVPGVYYDGVIQNLGDKPPESWRCKYIINTTLSHGDDPKRRYVRFTVNTLQNYIRTFTKFGKFQCNDSCACNNRVALIERVIFNAGPDKNQGLYPQSQPWALERVKRVFRAMAQNFRDHTAHTPLTAEETMLAFKAKNDNIKSQLEMLDFNTCVKDPERYKRSYEYWKETLCLPGTVDFTLCPSIHLTNKWGKVRPFAKVESISTEKWPRNISPRHPHFNFIWAQFTKPLEAYFYKNLGAYGALKRFNPHGNEAGIPNRYIGKGLNKLQRGKLLEYKYNFFYKIWNVIPIVLSTDCTGFDAHMTELFINLEVLFFLLCYLEYKRWLKEFLGVVIENDMISDQIRIWLKGGRMSGDMHTGFGNSMDVCAMIIAFFDWIGIRRYDILCDGDDTLVFIHPDDFEVVPIKMKEFFLACGHELKIEKVARTIFDVEWCQTRPIRVYDDSEGRETFVMVQNPLKTFATMGSHIHCRTPDEAYSFFADVLYAYSIIYHFIPLYSGLGGLRQGIKPKGRTILPGLAEQLVHREQHLRCSSNTLVDWCNAFGLGQADFEGVHVDPKHLMDSMKGVNWREFHQTSHRAPTVGRTYTSSSV